MNKEQVSYAAGRVFLNESIMLLPVGMMGYNMSYHVINFCANPSVPGLVQLGLTTCIAAAITGLGWEIGLKPFLKLKSKSKKIKSNPQCYPLEFADKVVIDDNSGLESLLDKTAAKGWREWGTFLKAHPDKDRAVIDEIVEFEELKKEGIVNYGGFFTFRPNITLPEAIRRFNGLHHYHPGHGPKWFRSYNYSVSRVDRRAPPLNWLNLITFNMPEGPEIIGYNILNTYIPADKTKKILVKANNRQIMQYLGS